MVEDYEDDEEVADSCDPDYYKSFLVGSTISTGTIQLKPKNSFLNLVSSFTTFQENDQNVEINNEPLNKFQNVNFDNFNENCPAFLKKQQQLIFIKNTTDQKLHGLSLLPASEKSCIDDLSYDYTSNTSENIFPIYSNSHITKGTSLNNFVKNSENKINIIHKNNTEKENEKINITKQKNINYYTNFLSYITENLERKIIPISLEQLENILPIINKQKKIIYP